MKKNNSLFILLIILFIITSCSVEETPTPDLEEESSITIVPAEEGTYVYDENTPVYVIINAHNEKEWGVLVDDYEDYKEYRADLLEKIEIIEEYNAKLNWQSDSTVLLAMQEHEQQEELLTQTDGKNILQYMNEKGISIDPHLHPNPYSYADIAFLIEQMGIESSSVIGGTLVFGCEDGHVQPLDWYEELELEQDGIIYGKVYPEATWQPSILTGAAFGGHWADDTSSGVWKPGNGNEFFENDPTSSIIYIGQGYAHDKTNIGQFHASGAEIFQENNQYIKELINMIQTGRLPSGKMYTALIHIRDRKTLFDTETKETIIVNDGLRTTLEELQPFAEQGLIKYITYQQAVEIWQEEYNSEPSRIGLKGFSMYEDYQTQIEQGACTGGSRRTK